MMLLTAFEDLGPLPLLFCSGEAHAVHAIPEQERMELRLAYRDERLVLTCIVLSVVAFLPLREDAVRKAPHECVVAL